MSPTVKKNRQIRYKDGSALDSPSPSGKQKVIAVRDELWVRVDMHLRQIEDECRDGVNTLARIRKQSSFVRLDKSHTPWSQFGPNQGNAGKHVDALAGVVYGYMQCIELLDEILEDDSIVRRNNKDGQSKGSEEGKEAGSVEATSEEQAGSEEHAQRTASARSNSTGDRKPAKSGARSTRARKPR